MKITKYLVVALLLVTIGKKTLFASQINPDGTITGPPSYSISEGPIGPKIDPSPISTFKDALDGQPFTVDLQGAKEITGSYNAAQGTAKIEFSKVITTSSSVTPPSVSNPEYVAFGSISNPNYKPGEKLLMGRQRSRKTLWGIPVHNTTTLSSTKIIQPKSTLSNPKKHTSSTRTATAKDGSVYVGVVKNLRTVTPPNAAIPALQEFATQKNNKNITLWGLKVTGHKIPIKQKNKPVGYYWPESNIAQLNNGQTIVAVMQEQLGNYKPHTEHAIGPVWTRYSDEQIQSIARLYKTSPSKTNIDSNGIGVVTINGQKNILYGITLQQGSDLSNNPKTIAAITTHSHLLKKQRSRIPKEEEIPGTEQFRQGVNMSASQAATALYSVLPR